MMQLRTTKAELRINANNPMKDRTYFFTGPRSEQEAKKLALEITDAKSMEVRVIKECRG